MASVIGRIFWTGALREILPAELSDDELDRLIATAIAETGASSPKDMGQVMKAVMAASGGRAEGKRTSARVRDALGN